MSHKGGNSEISGFTAPENAPGQAASRASKDRLDALLAARLAKPDAAWAEASEVPVAWEALYRDLLEERTPDGKLRWDWRKALYIAWNCLPTSQRWPKYEYELATDFLGLTNTRTIREWKLKDPEIEERIAAGPKRLLIGYVADVLEALVLVATTADAKAHQDRKLFLELTGQYKPAGKVELTGEGGGPIDVRDVGELSDEELERIATGRSPGTVAAAKRT
jgi:hypothetical protein